MRKRPKIRRVKDDFVILNPPQPPFWRTSSPAKGFARYGLAFLSLLTLALALWPHQNGYREALSFQIARGEITTWLLFASMTLVLLYTSFRLFKSERPFSAIFCLLTIGGLILIAKTDPYSTNHLSIFVMLLLISLSWVWGVAMQTALETGSEPLLLISAIAATLGVLACFFSLGIGERVFLLSNLAAINVLFYEHILY